MTHGDDPAPPDAHVVGDGAEPPAISNRDDDAQEHEKKGDNAAHDTLKYQLLGPSLLKAGQDSVDQVKVAEIIYNASRGSKFFNHEEARDKLLTEKISRILEHKAALNEHEVARHVKDADALLERLEAGRDLSRVIVHVDCDAFFAAVEELERPELKDVAFAVGKGVLTTCNYHARRFGVRSGMASFVAKKLCPQLILLPTDHKKYSAKAEEVRSVFSAYDPRFEAASIDEAYLDITTYCLENDVTPAEAVEKMRAEVREATKVTVSAGIAANARLAKICSNLNKPNGQYLLASDRVEIMRFMTSLSTRKVAGVGRVFERELASVGIVTVGDIYHQRGYIRPLFGDKAYEFLMRAYLGLGRNSVQPAGEYVRKSVGTERTFSAIADPADLRAKLRQCAEELEKELEKADVRGRTVVLKVKMHTFELLTRQAVARKAVCLADELYEIAEPMLAKLEKELEREGRALRIRLLGLRCTQLVDRKMPDTRAFFGYRSGGDATERKRELDEDGWEKWPEEEFGLGHEGEAGPELEKPEGPKGEGGGEGEGADERWDCPVCNLPQPADERLFNQHIDLCLSRSTIRDAVQEDANPPSMSPSPARATATPPAAPATLEIVGGIGTTGKRKRGRPRMGSLAERRKAEDPRQKKLCFG